MTAPSISVVVPAYNAAETVAATVSSVLGQTFTDFELIVIDDGSTDATLRCLEEVHDSRLRVFSYPNAGLPAARNRGIARATGEFITFVDADDLWTPDKLELQLQALLRNPRASIAYSWTAFVDRDGKFLFAKEPCYLEGDVYRDLLLGCFVASGSNIMARRSCVDVVGGFDTSLPAAQDWDLCLRMAVHGEFVLVPRYQVLYRIWEGAMSSNARRIEQSCVRVCEREFIRAPWVSQTFRRQSLSNVKQYVAFLYLSRTTGIDFRKEAGKRLIESIRLYPRTLLSRKTRNLLLVWFSLYLLPRRKWRPAVTALLKLYGAWTRLTQLQVSRLVEWLRSDGAGASVEPVAGSERARRLNPESASVTEHVAR